MYERENAGAPDPGFGTEGLFTLPHVGQEQYLTALTLRSDDGLLSVATARSFDSFYVYGLTEKGILDNRFREGGWFQDGFGEPAIARLIHTRDDGKFLVAGELAYGVALARYTASGDFDPTFNGGRKVIIPHSDLKMSVKGLADKGWIRRTVLAEPVVSGIPDQVTNMRCVADNDRVYYGFDAFYGSYERLIIVVCLTHDGELDRGFGSGGHFILTLEGERGPWSGFEHLAIQSTPQGAKLLALGLVPEPELDTPRQTFLFRLDQQGRLDTSFGAVPGSDAPGIAWLSPQVQFGWALSVLASGTICVGGGGVKRQAIIAGCSSVGGVDTGFNQGEPVYSAPPGGWTSKAWGQHGVSERLIFAGERAMNSKNYIALRRFDSLGTPDQTFGENGLQQLEFTKSWQSVADLHILPLSDGRSYVGAGLEIYRLQA